MSYVLGVDLGTTTVAAAAGDADHVATVALGDRGDLAPAVVARRVDGTVVTGDRALRRASREPDRVVRAVRRRLGDPTPVVLGEHTATPVGLLGALLRAAVDRATAVRGDRPGRVVLTHPASWGPYRRGLFEDVATAAGIDDVRTVTDPEAAVRQVAAARGLPAGAPFAVLDLGGTSCEAAVVRDGIVVGVPVGVERLGGDDLDEAVAGVVDDLAGGLLGDLDPEDPSSGSALARFHADCLAAKEALSADDEVVVPLLLPGRHVDVTVRRAAFEERIVPVVRRVVATLREALDTAGVEPQAVLLVGGSARVPLVVRSVRAAVAAPVVVEARPDHVVALGAVRVGAAQGTATAADEPDGRTRLTPLRPPVEDGRTTTVRIAPGTGGVRGAGARPRGVQPVPAGPVPGPGRPATPPPPGTGRPGTGPPGTGLRPAPPPPGPGRAGPPTSGPFPAVPPGAPTPPPAVPGARPAGPPAPTAPRSGRGRIALLVLVVLLVAAALVVVVVLLAGG
ncbi:Hsp70 family protein [Actinomycetospora chiangmaiensis]|uniref:Hsp70 family protein n=1 Tax=Actinomycetospora chiangmaiensis TaxID=402650 RepID=UPI00039D18C2|nr:Hsp70 family protein [Actinomycetospora chiangmaiensis]